METRGAFLKQWFKTDFGKNNGHTSNDMNVPVECYSGRKAEERPVRFRVDGHEYVVEEVLDQWYEPEDVFFKVRADDGNVYVLRHRTSVPDGEWDLVSFRKSGSGSGRET
jgi:uncharacterized protein (UPF0128 family)